MPTFRFSVLSAAATLLSFAVADINSICYSYGVDFVDGGSYFINNLSTEDFTSVSTFEGCNDDVADVLFIDPNGDEELCDSIPTTPEDTPQLSTCPVKKSEMFTGDYILLIIGNNGDGQPFAWERDLHLTVGAQVTSTYTPTITYSITTTPIVTVVSTSTEVDTSTIGPLTTYTSPSVTAKKTLTVTPSAATTTKTNILTVPEVQFTKELIFKTKTSTATCTTPAPKKADRPCTYSPTLLQAAALATPTALPKFHRLGRKSDRVVDIDYALSRVAAAKLKREQRNQSPAIVRRAPDEATVTLTASYPFNQTITNTAAATTVTSTTVLTDMVTSTLPPVTVYSGVYTSTKRLPTPTKTRFALSITTETLTKTLHATFTQTTTVLPSGALAACKAKGGKISGLLGSLLDSIF